jgi:hypothetical protein
MTNFDYFYDIEQKIAFRKTTRQLQIFNTIENQNLGFLLL